MNEERIEELHEVIGKLRGKMLWVCDRLNLYINNSKNDPEPIRKILEVLYEELKNAI